MKAGFLPAPASATTLLIQYRAIVLDVVENQENVKLNNSAVLSWAGLFVNLSKLKWNDKIIIHLSGNKYVYAVQENKVILPNDTSVLQHEEDTWLTLLTCKTFNEKTNAYENRIAVRAVLVSVEAEKQSSQKGQPVLRQDSRTDCFDSLDFHADRDIILCDHFY
ncbi:MAG TPA: sortase [Anaerolineales bacterium]|nr:sortase [Anaerolineales bacterium]